MKKGKSLLALGIVFLVLLVAYFGLQSWNRNKEKEQDEKLKAETIYITNISDITEIKYNVGKGDIHLIKEDETWYDAVDKDFPLAQTYPNQIVSDLEALTAERELNGGDSLKEYGLEEPAYTIVLTAADGTTTTLYYGNATGDNYYVTVNDKEKVYTVSGTSISDMQYTLKEMAQLDVYPSITSGNLKKETITKGGEVTTYDSENEDDAEHIAAVAGGLGAVTLSEAADYSVEEKDLAGFGLDENNRITVEVKYTQNDEEQTLKLYIGNIDENGNKHVMINDSKIVYLISEEICGNILNE